MPDAGLGRSFADPSLRKKKLESHMRNMTPSSGGGGMSSGGGGVSGGSSVDRVSPVAGQYTGQYPNYVLDAASASPVDRLPPLNLSAPL
jgi:hypothetical protein